MDKYYEFHKDLCMMFVEMLTTNKLITVLIDSNYGKQWYVLESHKNM